MLFLSTGMVYLDMNQIWVYLCFTAGFLVLFVLLAGENLKYLAVCSAINTAIFWGIIIVGGIARIFSLALCIAIFSTVIFVLIGSLKTIETFFLYPLAIIWGGWTLYIMTLCVDVYFR